MGKWGLRSGETEGPGQVWTTWHTLAGNVSCWLHSDGAGRMSGAGPGIPAALVPVSETGPEGTGPRVCSRVERAEKAEHQAWVDGAPVNKNGGDGCDG